MVKVILAMFQSHMGFCSSFFKRWFRVCVFSLMCMCLCVNSDIFTQRAEDNLWSLSPYFPPCPRLDFIAAVDASVVINASIACELLMTYLSLPPIWSQVYSCYGTWYYRGSKDLNTGPQALWQVPLPIEPCYQPQEIVSSFYGNTIPD